MLNIIRLEIIVSTNDVPRIRHQYQQFIELVTSIFKFLMYFVVYGSLSTGHANTSSDMLSRLETMVLSAAPLPIEVIRKQIASALDIIVHISRMRDRSRKVTEIHQVVGVKNGEVQLQPLFLFEESGETTDGKIIGSLRYTGQSLVNLNKIQMAGKQLPHWITHHAPNDPRSVAV